MKQLEGNRALAVLESFRVKDSMEEKKIRRNQMKRTDKDCTEGEMCCSSTDLDINTNRSIIGWNSIDEVASSIWSSIHSKLLEGDLVFAYKTGNQYDRLKQIVIVRNFEWCQVSGMQPVKVYKDFAVGYITSGYTALLPHVPFRYISGEIMTSLEDWKLPKSVLGTYKAIIEDLEKEITTENNGQ